MLRENFEKAMKGNSQNDILEALHAIADDSGWPVGNAGRGAFCLGYLTAYIANENKFGE